MPLKSAISVIVAIAAFFAGTVAATAYEAGDSPEAVAVDSVDTGAVASVAAEPEAAGTVDSVAVSPDSDAEAEAEVVDTEAASAGEPVPAEPADTAYVPPIPTAHTKYIAVVETDVDEHSGAAAELSRADVRLVTAELRREAVKNLPRGRFNVMTTETVYAQGTATLIECHEENCVIALGSKIGADFIVRGTISKMETRYTLSVEIYETEDGNLVASSDPVRSETIGGLVENAAAVCGEMYRTFAKAQTPVSYSVTVNVNPIDGGAVYRNPNKELYESGESIAISVTPSAGYVFAGWSGAAEGTANPLTLTVGGPITLMANFHRESVPAPPPPKPKRRVSIGAGVLFASDFGGGVTLNSGDIGMPSYVGGVELFFDVAYAAISIAYHQGGGRWTSSNNISLRELPYMDRKAVTVGVSAKYPNLIKTGLSIAGMERSISLYPTLELCYELPLSGKLEYVSQPEYLFDGHGGYAEDALRSVWVKVGGGLDFDLSRSVYLRAEAQYGARTPNYFETDNSEKPRLGHGLTVRGGVGFRM